MTYWRGGEWAGVGPGAHGRIKADGIWTATVTLKAPEAWREHVERGGNGIETSMPVGRQERAEEYLLMGLRLSEGIERSRYAALGGCLDEDAVDALARDGLLEAGSGRLVATPAGRLVLNTLIAELVD